MILSTHVANSSDSGHTSGGFSCHTFLKVNWMPRGLHSASLSVVSTASSPSACWKVLLTPWFAMAETTKPLMLHAFRVPSKFLWRPRRWLKAENTTPSSALGPLFAALHRILIL